MSSRAPRSRALAEGGELRLVIPASCMVLRIFALTGIDQVIPNFAHLDEALQPASGRPEHTAATAATALEAGDAHQRRSATGRSRHQTQPGLTLAPPGARFAPRPVHVAGDAGKPAAPPLPL